MANLLWLSLLNRAAGAKDFLNAYPAPGRGGLIVAPDDTIHVSDVNAGAVAIMKDGKLVEVIRVEGRPYGLGMDLAIKRRVHRVNSPHGSERDPSLQEENRFKLTSAV
jgi:hypothetical protein